MAALKKAGKTVNADTGEVLFGFTNGSELKLVLSELSPEIQKRLALHGLSQKVGDSYASADTVEEAFEAATGIAKDLREGNWSTRVAGAGTPRTTLLAEAISRISGNPDVAAVVAQLEALGEEKVKEIRKHPQVKSVMADIKSERLKKASEGAPDLKSLFGG